jgi:TonB family protein
MIRLFAPPTSDAVLRRNALTAGNLLLHVFALLLLAIPVGRAVKESLLNRLVVFMVPPDSPGDEQHPAGEASLAAAASEGGVQQGKAAQAVSEAAQADEIQPRGDLPTLSAADLAGISRPRAEEKALTELEVDSAVVRDPSSAAPEYPAQLLQKGVEGSAAVLYVVDTIGVVDTMTYQVMAATHSDFAVAVRRALPAMRFRPALQGGHHVRQLVQQTFRFRITRRDTVRTPDPAAL